MYTRNEVINILESALDSFKTDVNWEMEKIVHMFVILLKQLYDSAESQNIRLEMNVSAIEDKSKPRLNKNSNARWCSKICSWCCNIWRN